MSAILKSISKNNRNGDDRYWFQVGVVAFWWVLNCYWFVKLLQMGMGPLKEAGDARKRSGNAGTKNVKSE